MRNFIVSVLISFAFLQLSFSADLTTHKETYNKCLGDIAIEHKLKLSMLADDYNATLKKLQETAQNSGDFEKTKAIILEISRFSKDKIITDDIARDSLPDVKKVQSSYIKGQSALELTKSKKILTLSEKYDRALGLLMAELTTQGKLDEASIIDEERKRVAVSDEVKLAMSMLAPPATTQIAQSDPAKASIDKPNVDKKENEWISSNATYIASSKFIHCGPPLQCLLTDVDEPMYEGNECAFSTADGDNAPYIIIDLGKDKLISEIYIENRRNNALLTRTIGLSVWLSQTKIFPKRPPKPIWKAVKPQAEWTITLEKATRARYIKIGFTDPQFLHLSRVKIFGS